MRIEQIEQRPMHRVRFTNAAKRGGTESVMLDVHAARASGLPAELDALVLTSDLQGVVPSWRHGGENVLLGVSLADELAELSEQGTLPSLESVGVVLAGDLYAAPGGDKRGASGDVRPVWRAMADRFRWVAGVAGNHDHFGTAREQRRLEGEAGVHLLDCDSTVLDGLHIGGVGGVIGDPARPRRKAEHDFLAALELLMDEEPDMLVLHEPARGSRPQRGNSQVRDVIESGASTLTVCGHVHWDDPLAELANGGQVVNVDSRVLVVTR